jgi:hypothetical protein
MGMEDGGTMEEKALALYAEGDTVSGVARALGVTWHIANKLRPAIGGAKVKTRKPKRQKQPVAVADEEVSEEAPEAWDLALSVPTGRMDHIFAEFTAQEKADAIAGVLQARLDALIAAD